MKGTKNNPTYNSWRQAQRRCTDPRTPSYGNYGAKGIKFLIRSWQDLADKIGIRPKGYTLDRIDSKGDYRLDNVRWASRTEQNRNRSSVTCSIELAKEIRGRFKRGQYPEDIAKSLNLNQHTVEAITQGKYWNE